MRHRVIRIVVMMWVLVGITTHLKAEIVFKDDFSSNGNFWRLSNSHGSMSQISGGYYNWKNQSNYLDYVGLYMNRLDVNQDFTVESNVVVRNPTGQYGFVYGGTDKDNALYIFFKGKKYAWVHVQQNKVVAQADFKAHLKIRLDKNNIKLEKRGSRINIIVNGMTVGNVPEFNVVGKIFGFAVKGKSNTSYDDFKIEGNKLPINELEGLYYTDKPVSLGKGVNSKYDEMTPVISPNGNMIYFSRKKSPQNVGGPQDVQDVYVSSIKDGIWQTAQNVNTPINNFAPNAVYSVTPDGNTLLLLGHYDEKGQPKGQGISVSSKEEGGWSVPTPVKMQSYYNKSKFNEYFLSNDGQFIVLAIQQNNSIGNRDLYVSRNLGDGFWSKPKNLGNIINTPGVEMSPFLASDGVTLYFSSNGHPGFGKNDIFMCRRLDDTWTKWTKPVNIGKPINDNGYNMYYSVPASGEKAYYVSSKGAIGANDIFSITLPVKVKPNPVVVIKGTVYNSKNNQPIAASITYHDFETNKEVGVAHSTPKTGTYEIILPLGKQYSFFATKDGFYSVRDRIDLTDVKEYEVIKRDLYLTPIEVGQTAQLHNVLFKRGTPQLLSSSYPELNQLAKTMNENKGIVIELGGHTDNVGKPELNLKLSELRVEAVRRYLIKRGVSADRITGKGYGGEKPIADNSKEETRMLNRRVEFKIVKF